MAADSLGNDVTAVGVPVTGHIGIAPFGTAIPTPVAGASRSLALAVTYKLPGLLTEDGGFEWSMEADGDPIEFWQEGFSLPSGLANVELKVKFAQTDEIVRSIIRGKTADVNGYITIDGGGTSAKYVIFTEEIFKNGMIRRRVAANATVASVAEDKSERGNVLGYEVTFKIDRSPGLENNHIGEWLIPAETTVTTIPTITAVEGSPDPAGAGELVSITGTAFATATAVTFGGTAATDFDIVSATQIDAVLPAGAAGVASVVVTNPVGPSAPFSYTRDV
ncbi:phage tail tube protein [Arthrobacter sp. Soil762]|uniref:phage tail tube protein n=1 Tax=Arthrobacter sp. Soil762 TaxID=1736401 RepID=UPI0006FE2B8D|nr:IPT/TIG domain-containing protein [Arthrobacter sp. Soil762]KRE72584.1 hypothetical protein ASG77_07900 [Arthrobacter sp. Soil762]